jgi:putative DNA methylase
MIQEIDMEYPKKLIEVALPLDDINAASSREKSIRHGHPSTLHLWWARRPLAAARAVLFAQLVNDPGGKKGYGKFKGQTKADAQKERERLFEIIRKLVKWENTNNEEVLEAAREEIRKSWRETCELTGEDPEKMPPFLDPFAGGGSIPLEAQRLGLEAHASDLNPVAVMINKAMIEIPPKFAGRKPVGPIPPGEGKQKKRTEDDWSGAKGLAEDVRRYGHWMREEAWKKIGHLYPQVDLPKEYGGGKATVIAWIWARTVKCPNPACRHIMPLLTTFILSSKKGKESYVIPIISNGKLIFSISSKPPPDFNNPKKGLKRGISGVFQCIYCKAITQRDYVSDEGKAKRIGMIQIARVVKYKTGRIFLSPDYEDYENQQIEINPNILRNLSSKFSLNPRDVWCRNFGLESPADLFTNRHLITLITFSDLASEVKRKVITDAKKSSWIDDGIKLNEGGSGAYAYGEAIATYIGIATSRSANTLCSLALWSQSREQSVNVFSRHTIPMSWDFPEVNPFSEAAGDFMLTTSSMAKSISKLSFCQEFSRAEQHNILLGININNHKYIISTDPPYYDNIGYADVSDFFYVWQRVALKDIFPNLFTTLLTPKTQEIVALSYRHKNKDEAEKYFMKSMKKALSNISCATHSAYPISLYYAFKQSETNKKGTSSQGWVTFIDAIIKSGLIITGTWPIRTERPTGVKKEINALASSIVLICNKRTQDSHSISRKQFLRELEQTLPEALEDMIGGKEGASPIAPVDLAQAAIGPGMAVYSKYSEVLEADGSQMTVHTALTLINKAIDEYFTQAESDMGSDTRFCVDWFLQYGFKEGPFGEADVLARAKGTTVDGIQKAGVIQSGKGKVRLLKIAEYPSNWDPDKDLRTPVWEACHHIVRALKQSETTAGRLLAKMPEKAESIRQLAYRLYTVCERKKWSEDARNYNELITSWYAIVASSHHVGHSRTQQKLIKD